MPPLLQNVSIQVEDDGIAVIKFNRPKHGNSLGGGMMDDLLKAFTWALNNQKIKVIVQTGEGKFYSTGMDLLDIPKEGPVLPDANVDSLSQMHKTLINAERVVLIAAVNGPAVGWGTSSVGLFDLVYSVPDAYFFTPFVKWGLAAEACASVTLQRALGRQKAAALILAGQRMTAEELESAGLITKVLPKNTFMQDVMAIARNAAAQPSGAITRNKRLMMAPIRDELLAANERECEALRQGGRNSEARDAIKAFERDQVVKRKAAKL